MPNYERAIRTLRAKGFEVERKFAPSRYPDGQDWESGCVARQSGSRYVIEVSRQQDQVSTIKVRRIGDNDDIMTDYFGGFYARSLKAAMESAERMNRDFVPVVSFPNPRD